MQNDENTPNTGSIKPPSARSAAAIGHKK